MQQLCYSIYIYIYTGRFIMFSVITNICNKKNKGPTLMEYFTARGKLKKFFFWQIYFFELCSKLAQTRSTSSSAVNGRPPVFCLHRHPVSVNCLYDARKILSVGGSFVSFARNARCTVSQTYLCDIPTHKKTSPPERPFYHYIHSHHLAAEMWTTMKNNLLGKKIFEFFLPSVQVS